MKNRFSVKKGNYAYTVDGRVIRINEIRNGEKYIGFDINETGQPEVVLKRSDIYGIAIGLDCAV